ncbi:MAG: hypothetical protein KY476_25960, partial [Planctomycetes bacterium]|nr:hypothetical protein [Planctomycetota bacterium]
TSRFLIWWAPVAAYYAVLHGNCVLRGERSTRPADDLAPRRSLWTIASIGIVALLFLVTPLGVVTTKHARGQDVKWPAGRGLSNMTPVAATQYLRQNPPRGLVYNTYEWGDYLIWAGPKGIDVFAGSHAHVMPREIWLQYLWILEMKSGWNSALARYGVNAVMLDPERHEDLVGELRRNEEWQIAFERNDRSEQSIVFVRRRPI